MEFGLTLAQYVSNITLDKVPQRDIDVAKLAIMDQIGVALAGVGEDPGVKVQAMVDRCTSNEATVLGNPRKTTTWLAALVNGTMVRSRPKVSLSSSADRCGVEPSEGCA